MSKQFYIKKTIQFSVSTVSMSKTVQFQSNQFTISTRLKYQYGLIVKTVQFQAIHFSQTLRIQTIQFSIRMKLVLFNPYIGPYQMLPFRARVDPGEIVLKGFSVFPKAPESLEPDHQIV